MQTEDINTLGGGQSFPEAHNGLPENANEREAIKMASSGFDDDHIDDDDGDGENYKAIPLAQPSKELSAAIVQGVEKIIQLKADRKLINAQIKETVEGLEGRGILRDALADSIKKMEWTDAKRESYTLGCNISGNALGIMEQVELFAVN